MTGYNGGTGKVVAAQLNYLAIYNPRLGCTDETRQEQIVFYYSNTIQGRHRGKGKDDNDSQKTIEEEENEKLRQVGLAQGIVEFARSFSNGGAVDSVETEKHRIVLTELEHGWWILASIDLTQLPSLVKSASDTSPSAPTAIADYSAREVSTPALLLQQLRCAHRIFLLHHSPTLDSLFDCIPRERFCNLLDTFWNPFARNWDVLLHGSPAVEIYGGIKLAAGGELGIGVGEEEWGSGEREVLEGLVRNIDGLVDLTVSRFGEPDPYNASDLRTVSSKTLEPEKRKQAEPWIGGKLHAGAADGLLFSGIGAVTRGSLLSLSEWTQSIYAHGENAYGVKDNPSSGRRKRRRRKSTDYDKDSLKAQLTASMSVGDHQRESAVLSETDPNGERSESEHQIFLPIVSSTSKTLDKANLSATPFQNSGEKQDQQSRYALADPEIWMKYLTLGYGSSWGGHARETKSAHTVSGLKDKVNTSVDLVSKARRTPAKTSIAQTPEETDSKPATISATEDNHYSSGHFIIGLEGDMEELNQLGIDASPEDGDWTSRISLRTLYIQTITPKTTATQADDHGQTFTEISDESSSFNRESDEVTEFKRIQVIVYVHRPFIFTLLFEPNTSSLAMPSFFGTLHRHLLRLHKPLLSSTFPSNVAARLQSAAAATPGNPSSAASPIFDLVYDPKNLTIHTSIPNIPPPRTAAAEILKKTSHSDTDAPTPSPEPHPWARVEALNVHSQILNTYAETRLQPHERERTAQTSRGWWVVWMRVPTTAPFGDSRNPDGGHAAEGQREAILIRRASDYGGPQKNRRESGIGVGLGMSLGVGRWLVGESGGGVGGSSLDSSGAGGGLGSARLAEGIGIDVRRYVESLLSLNR